MKKKYSMIDLPTIAAASSGNMDAINHVIKHYEGFIAKLALRPVSDLSGNCYFMVDDELRSRLETKLITKVLSFEIKEF